MSILLLLLSLLSTLTTSLSTPTDPPFIAAVVSESGLNFIKELLVQKEMSNLESLKLPGIEKSVKIPFIGGVSVEARNIVFEKVSVNSSTVRPGETGVVIVASGAGVELSMDWEYEYSTWLLVPVKVSDRGTAKVQVEGMEVGLTIGMKNQNGTLKLAVTQCGCYMKDIIITLNGGASWFYQGFVNAFEDEIRSAVENAITKKITEGTSKLDSLLQTVPKKVDVDKDVAINVTFVNDPIFGNSSIEVDINGLFIPSDKVALPTYLHEKSQFSDSCLGASRMLGISLEEAVFNSASVVYFQAGVMHRLVDKVPDQSLLNTASWKFVVPQLYRKYPNDDMQLNITLTSPPVISIKPQGIGASITLDMTVNVLDASETVPVACIGVGVDVSGVVEISGNNLSGKIELDDFTLNLEWSKVGNFHMFLIQGVMRALLNTVFVPLVNSHLRQGFPLPIIHGFTLQDAYIMTSSSKMVVCSDVVFRDSSVAAHLPF